MKLLAFLNICLVAGTLCSCTLDASYARDPNNPSEYTRSYNKHHGHHHHHHQRFNNNNETFRPNGEGQFGLQNMNQFPETPEFQNVVIPGAGAFGR
jgi:hypothetical protein